MHSGPRIPNNAGCRAIWEGVELIKEHLSELSGPDVVEVSEFLWLEAIDPLLGRQLVPEVPDFAIVLWFSRATHMNNPSTKQSAKGKKSESQRQIVSRQHGVNP